MSYLATIWVIVAATFLVWIVTGWIGTLLVGVIIGGAVLLGKATLEAVMREE